MLQGRTSIGIIAPSVDEAIVNGMSNLGLTRDQVDVEILDAGTKGLFGIGSRQARVRLTVKKSTDGIPPHFETTQSESQVEEALSAETIDVLATQAEVESTVPPAPSRPDRKSVEDEIAVHVARETVVELLEKMNINASVSAVLKEPEDERSKPTLWVDVIGQDLSILIGPRAETLNALQYIASLIISKELRKLRRKRISSLIKTHTHRLRSTKT